MKNLKGFTLVELVITIAIVIILSVVSVPIYRGYTKSAKMSEAYALLGLIMSAQKAYYSQYGNFLHHVQMDNYGKTANENVLGVDARGNKYFTYFRTTSSTDVLDSYFDAAAKLPKDLKEGNNNCLYLNYNLKTGPKFSLIHLEAFDD